MKFDLSVYYLKDCYLPLGFCIFDLIWSVINIPFGKFRKKNNNDDEIGKYIIAIIVMGYLFTVSAISLCRGGIYLLFEDESDQIEIEGIVEETIEIGSWTGTKYDGLEQYNNYGRGEALVINGVKYYLMSYGNTKVGDYVHMLVLPRSHFVLEIINDTIESPAPDG